MHASPRTILVAPDSFKGTFSALEVATAIGRGLARGDHAVDLCPLADGGEGTQDALAAPLGAEVCAVVAHDPLGREIECGFALAGDVAIVETAAASGLDLVPADQRDPMAASSVGTGELIAAAVGAGARTVYLGVGGSATTDGGAGAIAAIEAAGGLAGARFVVLCDVRTPFEDAARVFGPQKGADPDDVSRLTVRLHALAGSLPRDPRGRPMTGAAGGLSGGLWAAFGAELVSGAAHVLDVVGFDARLRTACAVITGEGRLDSQSLVGKLVGEVATRARRSGIPCHVVCGRRELDDADASSLGLGRVLEATDLQQLEAAGRALASLV